MTRNSSLERAPAELRSPNAYHQSRNDDDTTTSQQNTPGPCVRFGGRRAGAARGVARSPTASLSARQFSSRSTCLSHASAVWQNRCAPTPIRRLPSPNPQGSVPFRPSCLAAYPSRRCSALFSRRAPQWPPLSTGHRRGGRLTIASVIRAAASSAAQTAQGRGRHSCCAHEHNAPALPPRSPPILPLPHSPSPPRSVAPLLSSSAFAFGRRQTQARKEHLHAHSRSPPRARRHSSSLPCSAALLSRSPPPLLLVSCCRRRLPPHALLTLSSPRSLSCSPTAG